MELRVREARETPWAAKSVELVCPRCSIHCECVYPYGAEEWDKVRIRREVILEHVKVCSAGPAEVEVVYPISYPRA